MLAGGVNVLAHSADTQLTTEAVAKQQALVLRTNSSQEHEVNLYLKQALFQISPGCSRNTAALLTFQTVRVIRVMTSQDVLAQSLLGCQLNRTYHTNSQALPGP
jgi:hypothetical protein